MNITTWQKNGEKQITTHMASVKNSLGKLLIKNTEQNLLIAATNSKVIFNLSPVAMQLAVGATTSGVLVDDGNEITFPVKCTDIKLNEHSLLIAYNVEQQYFNIKVDFGE